MKNCPSERRCLICRRVAQENSSIDSEKLVSNLSLLHDFFNCFHINALDNSDMSDLSISCQICPTCELFIAEWSWIQTQITQLTRRAAQLKATLSVLLLSTPEIHVQNQDDYVAEIINNRIKNSQEGQLTLRLQQTVDGIRDELQKKYSARVMLDKLSCGSVTAHSAESPVIKVEPLAADSDNVVDEFWDQSEFGADGCNEENLLHEDKLNDEVTPAQCLEMRIKTEAEANYDESNSQDCSVDYEEMNVKAGKSTSYTGPNLPGKARSEKRSVMIPVGPDRFKYNGYDIRFNGQDKCYECGTCNSGGHNTVRMILNHVRDCHYTAEDKFKFTPIKQSDTEWLYRGKYKITKVGEKNFKCVSCWSLKSHLNYVVKHIQDKHVDSEGSEKLIPLLKKDTPSFNHVSNLSAVVIPHGSTRFKYKGMPFQRNEEDGTYTCGLCQVRVSTWDGIHLHMRHNHPCKLKLKKQNLSVRKVRCEICGVEVASQLAYRNHKSRLHKTGWIKCPTCKKLFAKGKDFKNHMKLHELGEGAKKYVCGTCGIRFFHRTTLDAHERAHTG